MQASRVPSLVRELDATYLHSPLSPVRLFVTSWTRAHQAPLSRDSPGRNTGVGCHSLFQGIFLTQGSNLCPLHWQLTLYH